MKKITLIVLMVLSYTYVNAQIVTIPDANFKAALIANGVDTNSDGEIQEIEAQVVNDLSVQNEGITSLVGIEAFTALKLFSCAQNNITSLDLTYNSSLETLIVTQNPLTNFYIGSLINLTHLNISFTGFTTIDLSNNNALTHITCSQTALTTIDLSNNINLIKYSGFLNDFSTLDFSNNTNIETIYCQSDGLTSLNVTNCSALKILNCSVNNLNTLDVSSCVNLEGLIFGGNNISSIDLSNNLNLTSLQYYENPLSTIDLSNNLNLSTLVLSNTGTSILDVSNNVNLETLYCTNNTISELDISTNVNLRRLNCAEQGVGNLYDLDVSNNTLLEELNCSDTEILSLDLSNNPNLINLDCHYIAINELNLDNNTNLEILNCSNNFMMLPDLSLNTALTYYDCSLNFDTVVDVSNNPSLNTLILDNSSVSHLFIKNGSQLENLSFSDTPSIAYICVDDDELELVQTQVETYGYTNCNVNSYCSFVPGGNYNTIQGVSIVDMNNNGCSTAEDYGYPFVKYNVTDGVNSGVFIGKSNGDYSIPIIDGNYNVTPQIENLNYFTLTPGTISVDFPTNMSPYAQDFCLSANGVFNDLEIVLLPLNQSAPGFVSKYQLFYKNKGTTVLSGNVKLEFNDNVFDFVSSDTNPDTQSVGLLNWVFNNLEPFQSGVINLQLLLNTPTSNNFPVNAGDVVNLIAEINPTIGDETQIDNSSSLNQTVVNSYDPNDKTCIEGKTVGLELVGEYVNYIIRFENNGTANAINIVVKDVIDVNSFDINSLIPLRGSHNFITNIKNTNEVEFIFDNINLPFDNANNDGFVAFKIKTKEQLVDGDSFENMADIYFDYNLPIVTNNEITAINNSTLSTSGFTTDPSIIIYPNPVKEHLTISANNAIKSINVLDLNGRLLKTIMTSGNSIHKEISLSGLQTGIYLVEIKSTKGISRFKIIKQ